MSAILFDATRCVGCNRCVEACSLEYGLVDRGSQARYCRDDLSQHRFLTILKTETNRFVRRACMHCVDPSCAGACLCGALHKTPEGPVVYDASKCIGCRYCMLACPFEAVKYEWDTLVPYVKKCEMCTDREGGPACVEICPHEALRFGDREELLDVARGRLTAQPRRYRKHIWGEHEAGGTHVRQPENHESDGRQEQAEEERRHGRPLLKDARNEHLEDHDDPPGVGDSFAEDAPGAFLIDVREEVGDRCAQHLGQPQVEGGCVDVAVDVDRAEVEERPEGEPEENPQ